MPVVAGCLVFQFLLIVKNTFSNWCLAVAQMKLLQSFTKYLPKLLFSFLVSGHYCKLQSVPGVVLIVDNGTTILLRFGCPFSPRMGNGNFCLVLSSMVRFSCVRSNEYDQYDLYTCLRWRILWKAHWGV